MSILCVNIIKLSFVYMCIKFDFSYFMTSFFFTELFQDKLVVLIKGMFKGKNAHSNLKRSLYS